MAEMNAELANAIIESSRRLGVDPLDVATAMSYETGGKFSTKLWGGKGGNYLGLIQAGPEERAKYGFNADQTPTEQVRSAENFLRDRGVKPGMGLPDIYSTINAGSPGLYNRSDANNGGAPGTVMDKVRDQMGPHREIAARLLGMQPGMLNSAASPSSNGGVAAPAAGVSSPAAVENDDSSSTLLAQLQAIPKMLAKQQADQVYAPAPVIPNNMAARLAAIAAAKQGYSA